MGRDSVAATAFPEKNWWRSNLTGITITPLFDYCISPEPEFHMSSVTFQHYGEAPSRGTVAETSMDTYLQTTHRRLIGHALLSEMHRPCAFT